MTEHNEHINTFEEEDEMFWEPTLEEKREMAKKRFKAKERAPKVTPEMTDGRIKKKFTLHDLNKIVPKTETQRQVCASFRKNLELHHFLYGSAGTGKTFLGLGLGLENVLDPATPYDKLLIVRSVVPSREIGYLPGDIGEKTAVYEEPYVSVCDELFNVANSYANLKEIGKIEFTQTSFLRGKTFNDCVILVDEVQNMNFGELDTIVTRVGRNSKIIFAGDSRQNDLLNKRNEQSGFYPFIDIISSMHNRFGVFEFGHNDIVRSGLVKEYIIRKETFFANEVEEYEKPLPSGKK